MNTQQFLRQFYRTTHIPISYYEGSKPVTHYYPTAFHPDPCAHYMAEYFTQTESLSYVVNRHSLFFGLLHIKGSNGIILLGPASDYPRSQSELYQILGDLGLPAESLNHLSRFLDQIPPYGKRQFLSYILLLNCAFNESEELPYIYDFDMPADTDKFTVTTEDIPVGVFHDTAEIEYRALTLIEQGQEQKLREILLSVINIPTSYNMQKVADEEVRAYKNIIISSSALAARAAIKGGLGYDAALNLSDYYQCQAEKLHTPTELTELWFHMLLDFARRTSRQQNEHSSLLVRRVMAELSDHVYGRISATEIADRLGYNRSYLCHVFRQETGSTISEYMQTMKIEEAKALLNHTYTPISTIAQMLNYSSQQYFQNVFKKYAGMTPGEYRGLFKN